MKLLFVVGKVLSNKAFIDKILSKFSSERYEMRLFQTVSLKFTFSVPAYFYLIKISGDLSQRFCLTIVHLILVSQQKRHFDQNNDKNFSSS